MEMPAFTPGEERLFFLSRDNHARLVTIGGPAGAPILSLSGPATAVSTTGQTALRLLREQFSQPQAGADLGRFSAEGKEASLQTSGVTASNVLPANGIAAPPRRFTPPDRGEPIRYLVDADHLPAGISLAEALAAVENALAAWSDASSATFQFDGIESFGMGANQVNIPDERLRIQLHDHYGVIGGGSTLGIGGQAFQSMGNFPDGGTGGGVADIEFHQITRSYVVLEHTASSMQNLLTFESILTHETGHALGLAHSSEDAGEQDAYLKQAIMYFTAHGDDRGASLADWDTDTIARTHPAATPAPFAFNRFLRAVTSQSPLTNPEVNQIDLRGYSLHADFLTPELLFTSSDNGIFSNDAGILTYTPNAAFSDSPELDPLGNMAYDRTYVRFSDGINRSPPVRVAVIQFLRDTRPSGSPDGLPDSWMQEQFGSITPVAGVSSAVDDPDGDGRNNLQEFLLGTDPQDPNSRFAATGMTADSILFQARPFEMYQLQTSPDLVNWTALPRAVQATSPDGEITFPDAGIPRNFFRVERVL